MAVNPTASQPRVPSSFSVLTAADAAGELVGGSNVGREMMWYSEEITLASLLCVATERPRDTAGADPHELVVGQMFNWLHEGWTAPQRGPISASRSPVRASEARAAPRGGAHRLVGRGRPRIGRGRPVRRCVGSSRDCAEGGVAISSSSTPGSARRSTRRPSGRSVGFWRTRFSSSSRGA